MGGRASPVKVPTRRGRWREWDEAEKRGLTLWKDTWGGRILPMPTTECLDAWWTNGRVIIGGLEVKHLRLLDNQSSTEATRVMVPIMKVAMALWLTQFQISTYLIVSLADRVLWQDLLRVERLSVWTPRDDIVNVKRGRTPEPVAEYDVHTMNLLSGLPLFTERSPGGTGYVVPG